MIAVSTPLNFPQATRKKRTAETGRNETDSFYYSKWCTGEREFYDMNKDSVQLTNRLASPAQGSATRYYNLPEAQLFSRLDALLMVGKSCTYFCFWSETE